MDAAQYISTLDRLRLLNQEPSRANFAVIDLAVDDRFLKFLYESDRRGDIQWKSLLENTRWHSAWQSGPVLLEFSENRDFMENLKARLSNFPLGVLVETASSFEEVYEWAQGWLTALADSDERIFRFYDPRSFRSLMATLSDKPRRMANPGATVYWNHQSVWHAWFIPDQHESENLPGGIQLSQAELAELPGYRMADRAVAYAGVYLKYLPADGDPRVWVLEELLEASRLGFRSASQQERWLRLRIRNDAPLISNSEYQEIMETPGMTPVDRLNAMESIMESANATA